jgi:hypothetical protein
MHDDRCFLLELPREIRDMIYQHALTHDAGLKVSIDTRKSRMLVYGRIPYAYVATLVCANPLTLVCHQLNHETIGAIFTANSSVALHCLNYTVPHSPTLNTFAKQVGTVVTARLQKITVSGSPIVTTAPLTWPEVQSRLIEFTSFCVAHPKMAVVVRFGLVENVQGTTWLGSCLALSSLIRGPQSIPDAVDHNDYGFQLAFYRVQGRVDGLKHLPANLRFSMLDEVPMGEMMFRMVTGLDWVKDVIPFALELWEDGI